MKHERKTNERRRRKFQRVIGVEALEARTMLTAAETFTGPSLTDLISLARQGVDTAPAGINRMLQSLETQLTDGPLADLSSAAVDGDGFVQEVQSLESSYEQNVDQQLSPEFPHVDEILKLAGQAIVAGVISLNQQDTVGLISSSDLITDAQTAIDSVTDGPILSLGTPLSGYSTATQTFEANLNTLVQSLSSSAATPLDPTQVSTTLLTEAEAYQVPIHAGLEVTHPFISSAVDTAVDNLENTASAISQDASTDAQSQLTTAISTFDAAILDTAGLFGPNGVISQALANHGTLTPNLTMPQTSSATSSVSGTATVGGTATLTATLTSSATGQAIAGETVHFTLDGAFAGQAVTSGDGVATLSGVATDAAVGTDSGGVVASFAGDINYRPSNATGDLVVSQAATTLGSVAGTATVGGTATLTATLTSSATNAGVSGETVSFTLDGTSVGTAVTNSSGLATLTGVATSHAAGTDTGGVVASFAGDTNYLAATNATGNLVVTS
jgi:ubiquinone biosynthesis protein UbiJ